MKKIIIPIILLVLVLIIIRFIPASQQKQILIKNKIENVNNYVGFSRNWVKWHPALKAVWQHDSTSIHTKEDPAGNSFTFILPGKEIKVTAMTAVQYHVQESGDNASDLIFSLSPDAASPSTKVTYAQQSNMLYRLFPFMKKNDAADTTIKALQHYLEDVRAFYGFDISLQPNEEMAFLVKRKVTIKEKVFTQLPFMFADVELWNKKEAGNPAKNYSIFYVPSIKDSVEITAGIALSKVVNSNDSIECIKVPAKQFLLVGKYEGVYAKKSAIYNAMSLYMMDNNIPNKAVFERFEIGKIPVSDSSIVKMELCFPCYPRQLSQNER